jgi:DNA (cytosine-5)-methyltransferase 1
MNHNFPYKWYLENGYPGKNGYKVFSCFACGGGSTMGYKLAGFDVLGMNEIDPKMAECYIVNHDPKYHYIEPIQTFKNRNDLPPELYNLDILDGSPPCSSFSMAGNREKDWGKEKKFKEGQAEQILDTLFFDFIDLAEKLQPKIVMAENVTGILKGDARDYVWAIRQAFDKAGYHVEHWTLDASKMGVPQRRERVFFIALRKDLINKIPVGMKTDMFNPMPELNLEFNEPEIPFGEINEKAIGNRIKITSDYDLKLLKNVTKTGVCQDYKKSLNGKMGAVSFVIKVIDDKTCLTINTNSRVAYTDGLHLISENEMSMIGAYPLDYNYLNIKSSQYLIGMSVPPVMTAQIATRIKEQWLDQLKEE